MQRPPDLSRLLFSLVAINIFGHVALTGGRLVSSLAALQAGSSELLVGCLIALYGFAPMLSALAVGRWVDRAGPFIPIRIGIIAVAVGVVLPALFSGTATLFVTAILCGMGYSIVSLATQYSVGQLQEGSAAERVARFGRLALGLSISGVLGPVVVGFCIDRAGYRAAFALMAVAAAVAIVLVFINADALRLLAGSASTATRRRMWSLVGEPRMRRIYLVGIVLSIAWDLFVFLIPILGHRNGLPATAIGSILAAFAVGTFCVRLTMTRLANRYTEWQILRVTMAVIIVVYAILPLTQSLALLALQGFALGAAVGCSQPNILSLLHGTAPSGRVAEAVGFRAMLGNASGVFVPLLFGATAASLGLAPVFWCIAGLVAVALPTAHRASRGHDAGIN